MQSFNPASDPPLRINYGTGITPTEELLSQIGERSFLRFWSHPNPHVNSNEELCDLLVVCGDFVIIFSDKDSEFKSTGDPLVGWRRWYRRAIKDSVRQLKTARGNLLQKRVPVYKDKSCTVPLGLPIPSSGMERLYRIAVVSRTKDLNDSQAFVPFIAIDSAVVGEDHTSDSSHPFVIGDVDPDKPFVHVMDVAGLGAVLTELDTVSDFAEYLDAREGFIRGKSGNTADSEWSILARFLMSYDEDGNPYPIDAREPGFTHITREEWGNEQFVMDMNNRRKANIVSRIWDALIDRHAQMLEDGSFVFSTISTVEEGERVVRHMALENRLNRRLLAKAWLEACQVAEPGIAANIRTVPHSGKDRVTYVFLNVSKFENEPEEVFRGKRRGLLQEMMLASLVDEPESQIVVGLAADLGGPPEVYDHAFLDVIESDGEQLRQDAQRMWAKKKSIFGSARYSRSDERGIPRP